MERQSSSVFNLETIPEYMTFCQQAVAEFENDQASVLRGFTAILALNHIPDWLQYKLSTAQRKTLGLTEAVNTPVKDHYENANPDLVLIRAISNGFKHLRPSHSTRRVDGYGRGPYGIGPFGSAYLLIDQGEASEKRWVVGLTLCKNALGFWIETLKPILQPTTPPVD